MAFHVRDKVKEHYGKIAAKANKTGGRASCCSSGCSCSSGASDTASLYEGAELGALPEQAVNASLGCANPLVFAGLKPGETVLDLGSGGGMDTLMAARHVGPAGKVYGLDMTQEMLKLANANKQRMGAENVEYIEGFIEDIPLPDATVDVIMSNCVINLSEDKPKALAEAWRVLKPGGRLAVADIVTVKPCPDRLRKQAGLWCSCLAGALDVQEYKGLLEQAGFTGVVIEPVHSYTRDIIENDFMGGSRRSPRQRAIADMADGVFAGALIKAKK